MSVHHSAEDAVDISIYRYEMQTIGEWEVITSPTAILHMLDVLGNTYTSVPKIMQAMHDGMDTRTSFVTYRARKHLDLAKA